jgi:hypothetical protein
MSDDDHGRQWDISPSSSLSPKLQDMPLPAQKSCKNRRRRGKYMLFQDKRRLQPAEAWYTYVSPKRLEMAPGEDTCETCLLGVKYVYADRYLSSSHNNPRCRWMDALSIFLTMNTVPRMFAATVYICIHPFARTRRESHARLAKASLMYYYGLRTCFVGRKVL